MSNDTMSNDTMSNDTMSNDTMSKQFKQFKRRAIELDRLIHSAIDNDDIEKLAEAIGYDSDMLYQRIEQLLPNLKPMVSYSIQLPNYPMANHSAEWTFKYIEPAIEIPLSRAEWNSITFDGPSAAMVKRASRIKQANSAAIIDGGNREKPATEVRYRTIIRKYLRTIRNSIAGEPIIRTAYVPVIISDIEDAEPCDFEPIDCPINNKEKQHNANHVRAYSKYSRAELKRLSVAEFNAATECAELLIRCANREEVIQLLESPLNPVDPNYISNAPDSIWQKENESISTLDLRGAPPAIRMSDWTKFEHTLWYAHAVADHNHWNWIGNAKHGDRTLVLKAAPFAEYRRRYLLNSGRAISPIAASQFANTIGIDADDMRYLCSITGQAIRALDPIAPKRRADAKKTASERVKAARERIRARRAAAKLAKQ